MEAEYRTYEQEKGMGNEHINFCYRQTYCHITFDLSLMLYKEANKNESSMSIELVIGRDHGKGAFR